MSITGNYGSYGTYYNTSSSAVGAGFVGAFLAIWIVMMIISVAISVLMIVSMWKIFTQNNKPGWYSLIPFLNIWTLFEIVGVAGWWSLIPFANSVFMIIVTYKLAIKYGKSSGFAVFNIFFPYIGFPILAFGKKKEQIVEQPKEEIQEEVKEEKKTTTKKSTKTTKKFCSECGTEMDKDAVFCPNCGAKTK